MRTFISDNNFLQLRLNHIFAHGVTLFQLILLWQAVKAVLTNKGRLGVYIVKYGQK